MRRPARGTHHLETRAEIVFFGDSPAYRLLQPVHVPARLLPGAIVIRRTGAGRSRKHNTQPRARHERANGRVHDHAVHAGSRVGRPPSRPFGTAAPTARAGQRVGKRRPAPPQGAPLGAIPSTDPSGRAPFGEVRWTSNRGDCVPPGVPHQRPVGAAALPSRDDPGPQPSHRPFPPQPPPSDHGPPPEENGSQYGRGKGPRNATTAAPRQACVSRWRPDGSRPTDTIDQFSTITMVLPTQAADTVCTSWTCSNSTPRIVSLLCVECDYLFLSSDFIVFIPRHWPILVWSYSARSRCCAGSVSPPRLAGPCHGALMPSGSTACVPRRVFGRAPKRRNGRSRPSGTSSTARPPRRSAECGAGDALCVRTAIRRRAHPHPGRCCRQTALAQPMSGKTAARVGCGQLNAQQRPRPMPQQSKWRTDPYFLGEALGLRAPTTNATPGRSETSVKRGALPRRPLLDSGCPMPVRCLLRRPRPLSPTFRRTDCTSSCHGQAGPTHSGLFRHDVRRPRRTVPHHPFARLGARGQGLFPARPRGPGTQRNGARSDRPGRPGGSEGPPLGGTGHDPSATTRPQPGAEHRTRSRANGVISPQVAPCGSRRRAR